ncbi:MAG: hypothetical protein WC699_08830 [Bacteroidales bacterium]|jgi:hypothetical protein
MERYKVTRAILFSLFILSAFGNIQAQELIFERKPADLNDHPNLGPNRRHFFQPFFSSTLCFPTSGNSTILTRQPFNGQISIGFRYKLKIINPIAIVSECGFDKSLFSIKQIEDSALNDTFRKSQYIKLTGFFGGIFLRVRFGQGGDYLGNYLDLGMTASAPFINQVTTRVVQYSNGQVPFRIDKTTQSVLQNVNPLVYKAAIRLGFDRISLIAAFRLTRYGDGSDLSGLPDFEIGIEISPVRY